MIRKTFYLTLFFLLSAVVSAQTPSPTPEAKDDVVVINTNLIQVDATVTDKNGKIVTDLTVNDFEIYENNEKQPITNFSFVELQPDKLTELPKTKPKKNDLPIPPVPNKLRPEQVRRTIALVVDDLGLSFSSTFFVKEALKKFVDEQMQPSDLVAIVRTAGGTGALQQFTSDKRQLYAAIEKLRWNSFGRGGTGAFAMNDQTLDKINQNQTENNRNSANNFDDNDVQTELNEFREDVFAAGTLGAVNFVVRGMRELPGRKAVMLFSDGFSLSSRTGFSQRVLFSLRRLTDLANRAAVVIYTMDARGLTAPGLTAEDNTNGLSGDQIEQRLNDRRETLFETQQGLRYLAQQTGGLSTINNNDLNKGLRRMLDDQKGYYLIGYQPNDSTFNPLKRQYNKLVVKLKRADLKVRYRSGFFGITDANARPAAPKTPLQQILTALTSPFATGEIDLRLTSLFANDSSSGSFVRTLIHVKGDDLKFTEDKDGWRKAVFDVVALTFNEDGSIIDEVTRTEAMRVRAESFREITEKGFVYTMTFPVKKPGGYQLRVVLRDATTSHIGSANQFVEIPNLKKDRLTISGIILQRVASATAEETAKSAQIQSDEQRDRATRRFKNGMNIIFGYAIYNSKLDKTKNSPQLTTQYKIFRDGREIFAGKENLFVSRNQTDLRRLNATGRINFSGKMESGEYVLQIIVRDMLAKEKRQIASQWIDFNLID